MTTIFALETDSNSLHFNDEKKQARLELAISLAIHSWDTLTTAVDSLWGGADSEDKRDWMVGVIVDAFDANEIDAAYIEEALLNMMQDEFESSVEDGSAQTVAELIIQLYQQIAEGDYKVMDEMYKKFQDKQERRRQGLDQPNKVEPEGDSEDEDEDEGEGDVEESEEAQNAKQGPVIDGDGFELVQRKKR